MLFNFKWALCILIGKVSYVVNYRKRRKKNREQ